MKESLYKCLLFVSPDSEHNSEEVGAKDNLKLKRQLTRGSSEKMMIVNRFKKVSEHSPERTGWRPRLSLRRKSCSLDETKSSSK